jgi:hypothetical protein
MAWIKLDVNTFDSLQTCRLARALQYSQDAAFGILMRFMIWANQYCQDGDMSKCDVADFAMSFGWHSDPQALFDALQTAEIVDSQGKIIGWDEGYGADIRKQKEVKAGSDKERADHNEVSRRSYYKSKGVSEPPPKRARKASEPAPKPVSHAPESGDNLTEICQSSDGQIDVRMPPIREDKIREDNTIVAAAANRATVDAGARADACARTNEETPETPRTQTTEAAEYFGLRDEPSEEELQACVALKYKPGEEGERRMDHEAMVEGKLVVGGHRDRLALAAKVNQGVKNLAESEKIIQAITPIAVNREQLVNAVDLLCVRFLAKKPLDYVKYAVGTMADLVAHGTVTRENFEADARGFSEIYDDLRKQRYALLANTS